MRGCLEPDEIKRLSAEEALEHPVNSQTLTLQKNTYIPNVIQFPVVEQCRYRKRCRLEFQNKRRMEENCKEG